MPFTIEAVATLTSPSASPSSSSLPNRGNATISKQSGVGLGWLAPSISAGTALFDNKMRDMICRVQINDDRQCLVFRADDFAPDSLRICHSS